MNHFTIFAHGENFDPDTYLKQAVFDFDRVWHRGEPRGCPEFIQDQHPTSGIEKILGNGQELSIYEQDRIDAEFLEKHEIELAELAKYAGVDTFILGLQYRTDLDPCLRGFCMSFSARLMYFALRTGVNPTFYVDLVPTGDWDEN